MEATQTEAQAQYHYQQTQQESTVHLVVLNHLVQIFLPTNVCGSVLDEATHQHYVTTVATKLNLWFGGSTIVQASGSWQSEEQTVFENVSLVSAYMTSEDLEAHLDDVLALARNLKEELEQEALALTLDHQFTLI